MATINEWIDMVVSTPVSQRYGMSGSIYTENIAKESEWDGTSRLIGVMCEHANMAVIDIVNEELG